MGDPVAPGLPTLPWFEAIVATAIVLALLAATLWVLKRGIGRTKTGGTLMSVEASLPLGDRRSLVVVNVEGRRLMIGLAPGQVRMVTELDRSALRPDPRS